MATEAEYLRFSPREMDGVLRCPQEFPRLYREIVATEGANRLLATPVPDHARYLGIGESHYVLSCLLYRVGFPVDVVYGGTVQRNLYVDPYLQVSAHLTVEQTDEAAEYFAVTDFDEILATIDPEHLRETLLGWEPDVLRTYFGRLARFFTMAGRDGHAVLVLRDG